MTDRFIVGIVGAPFGVRGQVKVHLPSGETSHVEGLTSVLLRIGDREKTFIIEETGGGPSAFTVKFQGIDSPEAAKALKGAELIAPRDQAAPLEENEFYIEDLKGLSVVLGTLKGETLGTVQDILEGGGGQLVELKLNSGDQRLVPFRDEFFGEVDLHAGKMVLRERWILE